MNSDNSKIYRLILKMPAQTEEEAVVKLKAVKDLDYDTSHMVGDDTVAEFLAAHGFNKLADAYVDASCDWFYESNK